MFILLGEISPYIIGIEIRITGILRGGAQVISTLVAKVALVKCPRMTARSTDQPTAESIA